MAWDNKFDRGQTVKHVPTGVSGKVTWFWYNSADKHWIYRLHVMPEIEGLRQFEVEEQTLQLAEYIPEYMI